MRSYFPRKWWARKDLNLGPMDYESTALTAELRARLDVKTFYSTWRKDCLWQGTAGVRGRCKFVEVY